MGYNIKYRLDDLIVDYIRIPDESAKTTYGSIIADIVDDINDDIMKLNEILIEYVTDIEIDIDDNDLEATSRAIYHTVVNHIFNIRLYCSAIMDKLSYLEKRYDYVITEFKDFINPNLKHIRESTSFLCHEYDMWMENELQFISSIYVNEN